MSCELRARVRVGTCSVVDLNKNFFSISITLRAIDRISQRHVARRVVTNQQTVRATRCDQEHVYFCAVYTLCAVQLFSFSARSTHTNGNGKVLLVLKAGVSDF